MPGQTSPPAKRSSWDTVLRCSFIASIILFIYLYNTEDTGGVFYNIANTISFPVYIAGGFAVLRFIYIEARKDQEKEEKEMAEKLNQARIEGVEQARKEYAQAKAHAQTVVQPLPTVWTAQACPVCKGIGQNALGYVCPVCKGSGRA